ncbi:RNA demethylase ALKBH10B-like protein [Drosera capensis]
MATPNGNVVMSDKMQFPVNSAGAGPSIGAGVEIHYPRPWFDERDGFISWLRAEFAASNAIIDALCQHLRGTCDPGEYDYVIGCIQQRRGTWTSVLHMQQYFPINEINYALHQAALRRQSRPVDQPRTGGKEFRRSGVHGYGSRQGQRVVDTNFRDNHNSSVDSQKFGSNAAVGSKENREQVNEGGEDVKHVHEVHKADEKANPVTEISDASSNSTNNYKTSSSTAGGSTSDQVDSGSQEVKGGGESAPKESSNLPMESAMLDNQQQNKEILTTSPQIFSAVENFEGKSVDVVEGMNLYDKLMGQTYALLKRPMKGRGREMIQLGTAFVDIHDFENGSETSKDRKVEPIPALLQDMIDRFVGMQATPSRPDSCIIDVFNEGDHSQPNPWNHVFGRPICILALNDCDLVFGRLITADRPGDYTGALRLSLTPGSLLVLQGKSADVARYAIPSIRKQRILVTFTIAQPRKAVPADGHRFHPTVAQAANWVPPPSHSPNHIRTKHYPSVPTPGVRPPPPVRPQLPPPNGAAPTLFVPATVTTPVPFPAPVALPPTGSAGWAAAATPRHPPPPRLPVPGTGVFLPPPGSGSSSPSNQSPTASAGVGSSPENAPHAEVENGGLKGPEDVKTQRQESNGSKDEGATAAASS